SLAWMNSSITVTAGPLSRWRTRYHESQYATRMPLQGVPSGDRSAAGERGGLLGEETGNGVPVVGRARGGPLVGRFLFEEVIERCVLRSLQQFLGEREGACWPGGEVRRELFRRCCELGCGNHPVDDPR